MMLCVSSGRCVSFAWYLSSPNCQLRYLSIAPPPFLSEPWEYVPPQHVGHGFYVVWLWGRMTQLGKRPPVVKGVEVHEDQRRASKFSTSTIPEEGP